MTRLLATLLLLVSGPGILAAQDAVTLIPGRVHNDSVAGEEVDAYTLELQEGWFVLGEADQHTVDVVVTVLSPDGARIASVDGHARGPETFQFDTDASGRHRIEIRAFEGAVGRYAIVVRRAEPVATRPEARVDQLMAAHEGNGPGAVVGVVRGGRLVFAKAYGLANLTHGVPFETVTRTNIGSTSKQFTAFAIALLAERGALSLDDDIREHLPELPDFGATVTIRNLLTHTSGYREFLNAFALAGRRPGKGDHIERDEIIALVQSQPELQNRPGAEWNYNNTGYALLTVVVERVTGRPFPEWMRENVFEPLGMESTVVRADRLEIVRNSAQGYTRVEDGWRNAPELSGAMGAGGIYTTVADLARWMDNFDEPSLGTAAVFRRMTTPYVLTDGDTTDYGLGLFVDEYRGLRRVHHAGADVAHRAMLRYFPALDAGVAALSNNANFNSANIADQIADVFFGDEMMPEGEAAVETFDPEGYDLDGNDHWSPEPAELGSYTGRYFSPELQTFYTVALEEESLVLRHPRFDEAVELKPAEKQDEFTGTFPITVVKFVRGEGGEVTGLDVSNVRTRGVRFERQ